MTHDITIPPEAVEAATLAIFRTRYSFDPVFPQDNHQWELSRAYAAAALRAGIAAWPHMSAIPARTATPASLGHGPYLILPLPQETRDD